MKLVHEILTTEQLQQLLKHPMLLRHLSLELPDLTIEQAYELSNALDMQPMGFLITVCNEIDKA